VEWALISQKVLAAIEKALYPIYDLTILSMRDLDQPYLSQRETEGVRFIQNAHHELYCTPYHSTRIDDPALASTSRDTFLRSLVATGPAAIAAQDLESLDIIYWLWPPQRSSFTNDILSAHSWTRLKRITFVRVVIPNFENMFHVLRCCYSILEIVMLNEIEVSSADGHEWKRLFEILSLLPKLEHLQIRQPWWKRGNGQRLLIVDEAAYLGLLCHESGHSSIKAALTRILQEGFTVRNGGERIKLW
jgi:hypothetical protein